MLLLSQPALAEDQVMSVIQQYLYNESGYPPPTVTAQTTAPSADANGASPDPAER